MNIQYRDIGWFTNSINFNELSLKMNECKFTKQVKKE